MKSKLIIKDGDIKNFSIDLVKDFEGCASALKFLKMRFGDKVDDLSLYGHEIKRLIKEDDKSDWAINFMLNLLKPQYRLEFYLSQLSYHTDKMEDGELKEYINHCFNSYSKRCSKKNILDLEAKMDRFISHVESEIAQQTKEEKTYKLQHELHVLHSLRFFLQDGKKKFTRHITDALMKLAEAKFYLNIVQYPYEENIDDIATSLMEYTELW